MILITLRTKDGFECFANKGAGTNLIVRATANKGVTLEDYTELLSYHKYTFQCEDTIGANGVIATIEAMKQELSVVVN